VSYPLITPLPSVDWIYIHDLTVWHTSASVVTDDEGRFSYQSTGTSERGHLATPTQREVAIAAARGEELTAVVRFPHSVDVTSRDEVEAVGLHPTLDGRYEVWDVHPTPVDTRYFLRRRVYGDVVDDTTDAFLDVF
jgi:hypothetical protein